MNATTKEKIIIKEAVDAILKIDVIPKKVMDIISMPYTALLTRYQSLRESVERNDGPRAFIADQDAEELKTIIGFLNEAHMITRDQREQLWELVETIRHEND